MNSPSVGEPRWLTVDEYATEMRLSRCTVYRMIRAGRIAGVQQGGRGATIRIPVAAVQPLVGGDSDE